MLKPFGFRLKTEFVFGWGEADRLGELTRPLGKKAMLVTGRGSMSRLGVTDRVRHCLEAAGIDVVLFDHIEPNPRTVTVDAGAALARAEGCEVVVGLGGGSAMDAAKGIATVAAGRPGDSIFAYAIQGESWSREPAGALPVVCVPTTAGTGSEANRYLVVTDPATNAKPGMGWTFTYPVLSVIDPGLMVSLPAVSTAHTGVDVFFHALEAYVHPDHTPVSDMLALEAIRLVKNFLARVYRDGSDREGRAAMALAAAYAGLAIDISGCVGLHGLAHPLSGWFDLAHGETLAMMAPAFLRYSCAGERERFATAAALLGEQGPEGIVPGVQSLLRSVDLNRSLADAGVPYRAHLGDLVHDVFRYMRGVVDVNPVPLDEGVVSRLYLEAAEAAGEAGSPS